MVFDICGTFQGAKFLKLFDTLSMADSSNKDIGPSVSVEVTIPSASGFDLGQVAWPVIL